MDTETTVAAPPAYVPPSEEKKAFLKAFAAAQGEFLPIARERTVSIKPREGAAYSFKYAELAVIFDAVRPALSKHGLSLRSRILPSSEPGHVWLQSVLGHAEGFEDVSEMHVAVAGDLKTFGGQLTYLRRYIAAPQLGVASEDDLDENGRPAGEGGADNGVPTGGGRAPAPAPRPQPTRAAPPKAPAVATAATHDAEPPPADTGAVIVPNQAKWMRQKLKALFESDAEQAEFLAKFSVGLNDVEQLTVGKFDAIRVELIKL